ncbi:MAG: TlyA family RNA methyltransferase [Firmicutes bacterium]|nr:TlyA family RNA methyltransferase [Bacillota bacterium]
MKKRIDIAVKEKYNISRDKAKEIIEKGGVKLNGKVIKKASAMAEESDEIILDNDMVIPYVGRGGLKMEGAVKIFGIDIRDKVCMDIGASTGGFTDCMLRFGAKKVYAVDVGNGQLAEKLKNDARVISMENTDIRDLKKEDIPDEIEFIGTDVSFISLEKVLPKADEILKNGGEMAVLVKPQFEAGREYVGKGGIVKDIKIRKRVVKKISDFAGQTGFEVCGIAVSPIKGSKGNTEYLMYIRKSGKESEESRIEKMIKELFEI